MERSHLEELGIHRWGIEKWIWKKYSGEMWTGLIRLSIGCSGGVF
jgi:hypothetical protein